MKQQTMRRAWLMGAATLLLSLVATADDTEIYLTSYAKAGQPNILFVLDSSGSMNNALESDGTTMRTRYQVMREVLEEVLASVPDTVNVGLLNYGGHSDKAKANGIRYPVRSLSAVAGPGQAGDRDVRAEILGEIDKFKVEGYTPIVQALYEAALYFRGEPVDYGAEGTIQRLAHPDSYDAPGRPVVDQAGEAETLECNKTKNECPTDVALTCSAPRYEFYCTPGADCPADIAQRSDCRLVDVPAGTYEEEVCNGGYDEAGNCANPSTVTRTVAAHQNYECLTEICRYTEPGNTRFKIAGAKYRSPIQQACQANYLVLMSDGNADDGLSVKAGDATEQDPVIVEKLNDAFGLRNCRDLGDGRCGPELTRWLATTDQRPALEGDQTIGTYTIAFAVEAAGQAYLRQLANLGPEAEKNGQQGFFTAANRAQLRDVFNKIVTNIAVVNHDLAIPSISVDPETGLTHGEEVFFPYFRPGISPRWPGNLKKYRLSRRAGDGQPVLLDSLDRPVYDESGNPKQDSRSFWLPAGDPADGGDITAGGAARLLEGGRTIYTNPDDQRLEVLDAGMADDEWFGEDAGDIAALIDYAYGIDTSAITGAAVKYRHEMGDILHSSPVIVNYDNGPDLIFVGTNEGFLHAIDTATGKEKFAFIPRALLPVLKIRQENAFDVPHPYGLDGPITVWKDDVKIADGYRPSGKTLLIVGMRRGGLNYYALDITDPDRPALQWVIRGGDTGTAGFEDLAQSWSKAVPATVEIGGKRRPALVFTGGYDPDFDQPDPEGRFAPKIHGGDGATLFIVDARSGEKIWQATFDGAVSIPANPRVIDIDSNGVADRIYVVDVEGRLYRIDLPDPENRLMLEKTDAPRIVQLADLGSNGSGVSRRFYNEPDAALVVDNGRPFLTLALGSGYRAHPLMKGSAIDEDYLFVVRDDHAYGLPPLPEEKGYRLIRLIDLQRITRNGAPAAGDDDGAPPDFGWALKLDRAGGEKALARAVTLDGVVYFTTFQPETKPAADVCSNASHTGRVYGLEVKTGKPGLKFRDITEPKLSVEFTTSDIPSEVVLVASRYEETGPGGRKIEGVRFDFLGPELQGLEPPVFKGLNKQLWEVNAKPDDS